MFRSRSLLYSLAFASLLTMGCKEEKQQQKAPANPNLSQQTDQQESQNATIQAQQDEIDRLRQQLEDQQDSSNDDPLFGQPSNSDKDSDDQKDKDCDEDDDEDCKDSEESFGNNDDEDDDFDFGDDEDENENSNEDEDEDENEGNDEDSNEDEPFVISTNVPSDNEGDILCSLFSIGSIFSSNISCDPGQNSNQVDVNLGRTITTKRLSNGDVELELEQVTEGGKPVVPDDWPKEAAKAAVFGELTPENNLFGREWCERYDEGKGQPKFDDLVDDARGEWIPEKGDLDDDEEETKLDALESNINAICGQL